MNHSFKKILNTALLGSMLALSSNLSASVVDRGALNQELSYDQAGAFEYDAANGWWWYKQQHKDKEGKPFETKTKMTKKEKIEHDRENKVVKLLISQNNKLQVVQERLEYAYPNIAPIYSKDSKGKKCLTNSNEDCFVFPLQPEAQHVPVLASWLSKPNPTNSKKWLRWQAKYFNHLQKISVGNRFAFLSEGPSAYPTNTTFVYNDNAAFPMSEKVRDFRENKIIESLDKKLGVLVFLGGNTLLENSLAAHEKVSYFGNKPWDKVNVAVVLPSKEAYNAILAKANATNYKSVIKFWKNAKILIRPDLFKKFNVMVTPSVIASYKTDKIDPKTKKKEMIWQNISTGTAGVDFARKGLIQFLVYNDIIKPVEMATAINAADIQKNMSASKPIVNEKGIYKDTNKMKEGEEK